MVQSLTRVKRAITVSAAVVLVGSVAAACGGSDGESDEAETTPIKILVQPAYWSTAAFVAQDQGFFEEAGLDVEIELVPNQAAQVPLLISGEAEFGVGGNAATAVALGQGLPFEIIVAASRNESSKDEATNAIVVEADSELQNAAQLEGKKVAMAGSKGLSEYMVRVAVEAAGGDPDKVSLVQLDQPSGIAALEKGDVDAALVFQPYTAQSIADGKRAIAYPSFDSSPGALYSAWFATKSYLAGNADVAEKFIEAIEKANTFSTENPEEANALLAEELELPADVVPMLPAITYGGSLNEEEVQATLDDVVRYGWNEKAMPSAADVIWGGA